MMIRLSATSSPVTVTVANASILKYLYVYIEQMILWSEIKPNPARSADFYKGLQLNKPSTISV